MKSCCSKKEPISQPNPPPRKISSPLKRHSAPSTEKVAVPPIVSKKIRLKTSETQHNKMAPGPTSPVHGMNISSSFHSHLSGNSRKVSGMSTVFDNDNISNNGRSRRESIKPRKLNGSGNSNITSVVQSLHRRSGDELGAASSLLMDTSYHSIIEWIRHERLSHLPAEGSSYDKVLAWSQLFIERLHAFDTNIQQFAGDSYLAAQLSYGYCAMLLQLGKDNAEALMVAFGFFYSTSSTLVNLLDRTELFAVSQEIKEQLILALADLVTLVSSVSTHFHKAIRGLTAASVSVNIYDTFPGQIQSFKDRCAKIAEAMWRHQLAQENIDTERVSIIESVRGWLAPEDPVLNHLAENSSHLAHEREELTCLWMSPYLARFLKTQTHALSFSGKPGSGKSILASVIIDRLQDQIGGTTYKTLFVPINARIPAETTPIAIAKTILYQLFEQRIGNIQLLQILGEAYERSRKTTNVAEYESILWTALERALAAALRRSKELVIVVDGLDESTCGESDLLKKLTAATIGGVNVRLITLGVEKPPTSENVMHVPVSEDRVYEDIATVVRRNFEHSKTYLQLSPLEQETIVDQITEGSHGSFQWAKLAAKRVRHENTAENFRKTVDAFLKNHPTITDFVSHTLASPDVSEDGKLMLLWLATSERPLLLKELSILASIQVEKQAVTDRKVDPLKILKPLVSLVFLQDGQVYLRHRLISSSVLDIFKKGKLIPTIKDRHSDLLTRLLIYIKNTVTEKHEPSLIPLDRHDTTLLLQQYPLLNFAVRYWPYHLTQTTTYTTGGDVSTAKEVGKIFPATITLLLLQNTLWRNIPTPTLLTFQTTITNLLRNLLTTNSLVTLQSLITLAILRRDINQVTEAIPLCYEITTLSRTLLTTKHIVTMQMATLFLDLTIDQVTSSRTDIMIKREETLLTLVETYKAHYGTTSEKVTATLRTLIEHYRLTKEEKKIQEIENSIRIITGQHVGGDNDDRRGNLHVHLKGHQQNGVTGVRFVLDAEEDEVRSETFDFEARIKLAEKYTAEGRIAEAERIFVEIWERASKECRIQYSEHWEQIKLKAVVIYSKFLVSQKRETEASSILYSVWEEYRHSTTTFSESSAFHFQEIAKVMTAVGLSAAALTIFKRVSSYYQSTNLTQTSSYAEIQQHIAQTSQQVMSSASSSSMVSESTLQEIVYEASSSSQMSETSFTATYTLVELYVSQHRWKDATHVVKKVLQGLWPSLFAPSIEDVTLPNQHTEKCIDLAGRLGQCYHYRRRFLREEGIRERVYRAVRAAKTVDDKIRERVTTELLRFYESSTQPDRVISTHKEILDDYIKHYGSEHPTVIKTLWTLAELTRPRPIFVEYYQRIIRALNKDSPHCHPEAIEPLVIVVTELWNQSRYHDAVPYYSLLFTTWLHDPKRSSKFQESTFVQEFFGRYTQCLRSIRTEYTGIHKVTTDYQTKVKLVFGATVSITIKATLILAKVCQESKRYESDAIRLYEELLKIKSDEIDHVEISAILDGIYEEQTAHVAFNSESISSSQLERTSNILRKRITSVRETYGWAHEESLSKLKEIVSFYSKHSSSESVHQELKQATVHILSSESSSTQLVAAAVTIASSYITTNQISKATELSQELYRQVVIKDTSKSKDFQFDISAKGRHSLIFLAQLEHSIHQRTSTITEILALLTTEYVYFEEFRGLTTSKTSTFDSVSLSASRLYHLLLRSNRQTAATRVFDDYVAYFLNADDKRIKLTEIGQVKILLATILNHFSTHQSSNFVRSIGIAANDRIVHLLEEKNFDGAADLAIAAFRYISAQDVYRTPAIVKFVFTLGVLIAGQTFNQPDKTAQKKLHDVSVIIIQDVFRIISDLRIDLAEIGLDYLNTLIGLFGKQGDYKNLVWLLSGLWNSRNQQVNWSPAVNIQIARRYILASYLVGDALKASRLAEDIAYNCRRVNGARHPSTIEMSTLLTQLYIGIAQNYQTEKGGQHMANKYYKKSAAIHENLLRIFVDPLLADFEGGLDSSLSADGSAYDLDLADSTVNGNGNGVSNNDGKYVRQHLQLLKLAVQRLGGWPKDFAEYERLNADLFLEFGHELEDFEGVEKWNLKDFGSGKAPSNEDTLSLDLWSWKLELQSSDDVGGNL